jgi:hypothetical protein
MPRIRETTADGYFIACCLTASRYSTEPLTRDGWNELAAKKWILKSSDER